MTERDKVFYAIGFLKALTDDNEFSQEYRKLVDESFERIIKYIGEQTV